MEIEITHPENPYCRVRFRVSRVLCDRSDLLMVTIADAVVHHIIKQLALSRGKKVVLTDLMERSGPCRYQIRNPQASPYLRVISRPRESYHRKLNRAMRNPVRAFNDPELRPFVQGIFTRRQEKE